MDIYHLKNDLTVFGNRVNTFPLGIGAAFEALAKKLPDGFQRPYYGISYFDIDATIVYNAATAGQYEGEAEKYNCEKYIIEKGDYLTVTIQGWRSKTDSIKDIFHAMMQDSRADTTKPCIEWYKTDDEMLCMIRTKESR